MRWDKHSNVQHTGIMNPSLLCWHTACDAPTGIYHVSQLGHSQVKAWCTLSRLRQAGGTWQSLVIPLQQDTACSSSTRSTRAKQMNSVLPMILPSTVPRGSNILLREPLLTLGGYAYGCKPMLYCFYLSGPFIIQKILLSVPVARLTY